VIYFFAGGDGGPPSKGDSLKSLTWTCDRQPENRELAAHNIVKDHPCYNLIIMFEPYHEKKMNLCPDSVA